MRANDFEANERVIAALHDGDIAAFCTFSNRDELPPELDFIACGYFTDNPQSKRVQEKCGFKFYKYSKYTTAYGVTKDECINVLFG